MKKRSLQCNVTYSLGLLRVYPLCAAWTLLSCPGCFILQVSSLQRLFASRGQSLVPGLNVLSFK